MRDFPMPAGYPNEINPERNPEETISTIGMIAIRHDDGRSFVKWQAEIIARDGRNRELRRLGQNLYVEGQCPDYPTAAMQAQAALEDLAGLATRKATIDEKYQNPSK